MDWGLVEQISWLASVAAVVGAAGGVLAQWAAKRRQRQTKTKIQAAFGRGPDKLRGSSLVAPTGRLPPVVRGRRELRRRLRRSLRRSSMKVQVLAGMGGVGKSTLALELYQWAAAPSRRPRPAWWISAHDSGSLTDGLVSLARVLNAADADVVAIRAGTGAARDRLWQLLECLPARWLLVFDDADDPRIFDPDGDGKGWLRPCPRGLVLVTSRVRDERVWGHNAEVHRIDPLSEDDAVQVLADLAPGAVTEVDLGSRRELARRLGFLPLGLYQAGTCVGSRYSQHGSFSAYLRAWRSSGDVLAWPTGVYREPSRTALMQTWELSLDALTEDNLPQEKPLLRVLSCFAAVTPIPEDLLVLPPVRKIVDDCPATDRGLGQWVEHGIAGLAQMSLLEREMMLGRAGGRAVVLHPIVAEVNRLHLNNEPTVADAAGHDTVRGIAVELMHAAVAPLRPDDSRDWAGFERLATHLRELVVSTAGHLDCDGLARLVHAVATVVAFYAWSNYEAGGERLAEMVRPYVERLDAADPARIHLDDARGWATGRNGRWADAAALLRDVVERSTNILGAEHPDTLDTRHKLAWALGRLGDWSTAARQLSQVYHARARVLGAEHPDTLHTRGCLGWARGRLGFLDEAETELRLAHSTKVHVYGEEYLGTWDSRHALAELMVHRGRFTEAEQMLRELIAVRDTVYGLERPETLELRPRYWLARALRGQGRHSEADRELACLLADQQHSLGPDHPAAAETRRLLLRRSSQEPAPSPKASRSG
jgi:Tetratricopeptide repeat/NB-ARC domain